jgi:two-component sensor histidine kinase
MFDGSVTADTLDFGSGSRMARKVRDFDWAATRLGPAEDWPPELVSVVRQILESGFPSAVVWGPGLTTIYNDAFLPILGDKPEALGRSFADVWAEAWSDIGPMVRNAFAGASTYIENFPLVVDRSGRPEQAHFTFCYSPIYLADGTIGGMIDTVIETTEAMQAKADLAELNGELGHRLKNTLALVQAIASQTLRDVTEQDSVESFRQRISALSHAHDLLIRHDWSGVSLAAIVRDTLSPLGGRRQIAVEGADMPVGSHAALTLSLILHELATNAAKYGALSSGSGRVAHDWRSAEEMLRLRWRETGGPPVEPPEKVGFGSRLVDRGLGAGCTVDRRFHPEGFELDLNVPLRHL